MRRPSSRQSASVVASDAVAGESADSDSSHAYRISRRVPKLESQPARDRITDPNPQIYIWRFGVRKPAECNEVVYDLIELRRKEIVSEATWQRQTSPPRVEYRCLEPAKPTYYNIEHLYIN